MCSEIRVVDGVSWTPRASGVTTALNAVQWLNGNSGSTGTGNGRWTLWSIDGDTATARLLDENGNVTYTRAIQSSQP